MNITQFTQSICLAIAAGIIGTAYRQVLAYKFPPVKAFFKWGQRFEGRWFYPPVWGCTSCISGQISLWLYLALHFYPVISLEYDLLEDFSLRPSICTSDMQYSIVGHILAICGAIVLSVIFTNQYNRAENGGA